MRKHTICSAYIVPYSSYTQARDIFQSCYKIFFWNLMSIHVKRWMWGFKNLKPGYILQMNWFNWFLVFLHYTYGNTFSTLINIERLNHCFNIYFQPSVLAHPWVSRVGKNLLSFFRGVNFHYEKIFIILLSL